MAKGTEGWEEGRETRKGNQLQARVEKGEENKQKSVAKGIEGCRKEREKGKGHQVHTRVEKVERKVRQSNPI